MDHFLFQKINTLAGQWPLLDNAGVFFAKYLPYILVLLALFIFWKKWRVIFQFFLAAVVAKFIIVDLIRWLWPRPRPFVDNHVNLLIEKLDQAAFPSGHAALLFALSAVVFLYNKKIGIFFLSASFLVAIARVFAGLHWPSDILAGALVGIFSGWLVVKIFRR